MEFDQYGIIPETSSNVSMFETVDINPKANIFVRNNKSILKQIDQNEDVFKSLLDKCQKIADKFKLHITTALTLLENNKWSPEIVEDLLVSNKLSTLSRIGIEPELSSESISLRQADIGGECEICTQFFNKEELLCLPCRHSYCEKCWKMHVEAIIQTAQTRIPCMAYNCQCRVPLTDIKKIASEKVYEDLIRFTIDAHVSMNDAMTNCPNPKCSKPLCVLRNSNKNRLCNVLKCVHCNFEFCISCGEKSHAPASCIDVEKWKTLTDDTIMEMRLFGDNFKKCPNCHTNIEKNGGCNHMTCFKCHHQFCWMCLRQWSNHPQNFYECKQYNRENDPFLKRPDEINPEFINPYHDRFTKLSVKFKEYEDNKEVYISGIVNRLTKDIGVEPEQIKETVAKLIDQLQWAYGNLQWAQAYLFNRRNEQFQHFRIVREKQINGAPPPESHYLLVKMAVDDLTQFVDAEDKLCTSLNRKNVKQPTVQPAAITKSTATIKIYRERLLKLCDQHY
jgi:hypothetical protein